MERQIVKGAHVAVKPSDINVGKGFRGFIDTFRTSENEGIAAFLVCFAQARGSWEPFQMDELDEWSKSIGSKYGVSLDEMVRNHYIAEADGTYYFTYLFVGRAYGSSPVID